MRKCRKYMSQKLYMLMVGTMTFSLSSVNIVQATTFSLEDDVKKQNQVVIVSENSINRQDISLEECTENVKIDEVHKVTSSSIEVKKSRIVEPEMKTTEPVQELDIASGDITITSNGTYRIYASPLPDEDYIINAISVGENFEGTIILDNIVIFSRMEIAPTAKVELVIKGINYIEDGIHFGNAGPTEGRLTINGYEQQREFIPTLEEMNQIREGWFQNKQFVDIYMNEMGKELVGDQLHIMCSDSMMKKAAIGGDYGEKGENIHIENVCVVIEKEEGVGAGIGGSYSDGNNITITNATVLARGGSGSAGIGGSAIGQGKDITIKNSQVLSYANTGAGIGGGGQGGNGQGIIIEGASVIAVSQKGAGIGGGGQGGNGQDITITNSNVIASATYGAAGIGGGGCWINPTTTLEERPDEDGTGGLASNITIHGGTVVATGGDHKYEELDNRSTRTMYFGGSGIGGGGGCKSEVDGENSKILIRKGGQASHISILNNANVAATGKLGAAGIGGNYYGTTQTIEIDGEATIVNADGQGGAGIGGGAFASGSGITIKNGEINATSIRLGHGNGNLAGGSGAGIGGGTEGVGKNINILGGTVISISKAGGAGIGGGYMGEGSSIDISGGTVDAKVDVPEIYGNDDTTELYTMGAGIGGGAFANGSMIAISGGDVEATGGVIQDKTGRTSKRIGYGGSGIGGGTGGDGTGIVITGTDTRVIATGGIGGAGIGGGIEKNGTGIEIKDGDVTAIGGDDYYNEKNPDDNIYYGGTGIGGGGGAFIYEEIFALEEQGSRQHARGGSGQNIVISGGIVNAFGKKYSAGIGSGCYDEKGLTTADTITISNATVRAFGGENGAGIGGGDKVAGKNITITNANVESTGGSNGAGIGGGSNGAGNTIKVENSVVVATRGENNTSEEGILAAGIGGGFATQGTERTDSGIQIIGGSVWCEGQTRQDAEPKEVQNGDGTVVKNVRIKTDDATALTNVTIKDETIPYATNIDGNEISMYVPVRKQIAIISYCTTLENNISKRYKIFPNPMPVSQVEIPLIYKELKEIEIVTKDQYGNKIGSILGNILEQYEGNEVDQISFETNLLENNKQDLIIGTHIIKIDDTKIPEGYELPRIKELVFDVKEDGTLVKNLLLVKTSRNTLKSYLRGTKDKQTVISRSGKRSYIKSDLMQENTGIAVSPDGKQIVIQLHSKNPSSLTTPTMTIDYKKDWTNLDVPVTIMAKDNNGISKIELDGIPIKEEPSNPQELEYTHMINESGEHTITVVNKDGQKTSETIRISIDKENPTGEVKEVNNKKILAVKDTGGSGIDKIVGADGIIIYQSLEGTEVFNEIEIPITKVQEYTVYDKAGNTVNIVSLISGTTEGKQDEEANIVAPPSMIIPTLPEIPAIEDEQKDKETNVVVSSSVTIPTLPEPSAIEDKEKDEQKDEEKKESIPSVVLEYEKGWTNKDVTVHITALDEKGLSHITMPDGAKKKPNSLNPSTIDTKHVIKENGEYTYVVVSKDGKEINETITIKIDKIAPTVTIKQQDKKYTLYAKDKDSGVAYVVTPSGKIIHWKKENDTTGLKVSESGTYTVYDKAGNKGIKKVVVVENNKEVFHSTIPVQLQNENQEKNNSFYSNGNIGAIQIEVIDPNGKKDVIYIPEAQVYLLESGKVIEGKDIGRSDIDKIYYIGNSRPIVIGLDGKGYYYVKTIRLNKKNDKKNDNDTQGTARQSDVVQVNNFVASISNTTNPKTGDLIYKYIPAFVLSGFVMISSWKRKRKMKNGKEE